MRMHSPPSSEWMVGVLVVVVVYCGSLSVGKSPKLLSSACKAIAALMLLDR